MRVSVRDLAAERFHQPLGRNLADVISDYVPPPHRQLRPISIDRKTI
jgi:hypothetical protein